MKYVYFLLTLLLCAACVQPSRQEVRATPSEAGELAVLTFNIRYGTADDGEDRWSARRELVAETIRSWDPAVLALQEALAFQADWLLERFPYYQKVGQHRGGGRNDEFSGLFVDTRRLTVTQSGEFWLSETPNVPGSKGWDAACTRMCVWARIEDREGNAFLALGTHLDHRGERARNESASMIAEHLAGRDVPALAFGDFNAGEDSDCLARLRESGLTDTFRTVHPDAIGVGTFSGFAGRTDGAKIDYVLATSEWRVLAAAIDRREADGRNPSDHFPVGAWVTLPR